jgi:uncharacterized protein (DUF2126 family)
MLYVFLPPTDYLERLHGEVTSIEITGKLQMPVRIEGITEANYRVENDDYPRS